MVSSPFEDFARHSLKNHKKLIVIFLIEWIFILLCGIASFMYLGGWIQNMINQSLVTSPTNDLFELWKNPPVQPILSLYLFNYTNVDSWLKGLDKQLKVEEVGPYCYQEIWQKQNVEFHK